MRIISQDGALDVPYEMVVIQEFRNAIYFLNRNLSGVEDLTSDIMLAEYSTEAKAIKAMEMLREEYLKYMGIEGHASLTGQGIIQPNFWVLPKVFQFPQDEEIEV